MQVCAMSPMTMSLWMPCFLSCKSKSVLAKPLGTPVFLCDNLTWRRHEFGTELATPCAVFEALVLPRGSLDRRDVRPCFVVACTISMMHGIEDAKLRCARGIQDLQHVGNAFVCFSDSFDAGPDLAALGNEVVVGIHHQQRGDALVVCRGIHGVPSCGGWIVAIC